jgi:transposase
MEKGLKKNVRELPLYLMFQDEGRFGRLSDTRHCWAPTPLRPKVKAALIREYKYVFLAVCNHTGHIDFMIADDMRTPNMSLFLSQVSKAHHNKFIEMVVDGASTHKAKDLIIPNNITLIFLPPYSPELNPTEVIWNVLRRDYMANRYYDTLQETIDQVKFGLLKLKNNKEKLKG